MRRRVAIGLLLVGMLFHDAAAATVAPSGDALDADLSDEARLGGVPLSSTSVEPVTSVRVAAPQPAPERAQSANPLWGIPLTQLSGTRDRPIFSPSRRPPPAVSAEPVQVRPPPPRKKQVEPPLLSLVGTIASEDESYGIFLDQATKMAIRLKLGDDYQGWKLRTIQGREVTIEKDQQGAVLTLPEPGGPSGGEIRLIPVTASKMPMATQR
jgi:general secretion pathway protein N